MKKESSRFQPQPAPEPHHLPARHQFDHEVPTVIHHPEEDMTVMGRWAHRALQDPVRLWGTLAGIVAAVLGIVLLTTLNSSGSARSADIWSKLETAKSPAERVDLAKANPTSPAAKWALLQAATEYFNQGFADLPNNKDVALPTMKKALDLFDQVSKESPQDSPEARAAALGKARTLEARNEIDKAIAQYALIQKTWPGSAEAAQAKQLGDVLKRPDAVAFYKQLYAYSPSKVTLPPEGTQKFDMPLLPAPPSTSPATSKSDVLLPSIPLLPPPPPSPFNRKAEIKAQVEAAPAKPNAAIAPDASRPKALKPELPSQIFGQPVEAKKP